MALKDSLKHFSNTDGYSSVLTKSDFDFDIDTLADNIDTNSSNIDKKMDKVITNGDNFKRYVDSAFIATSDDTQTTIKNIGNLPPKSVVAIEIYSQNLQDDYTTKWIFKGTIYAVVKDDKTITADKDLTDVKKDDTDWGFDITANNGDDDTPANIDLKVTGKASTNINWSVFVDIKINNF